MEPCKATAGPPLIENNKPVIPPDVILFTTLSGLLLRIYSKQKSNAKYDVKKADILIPPKQLLLAIRIKRSFRIAFVVGGLGLIGKEVSKAFSMAGSKTIILDKNNKEGKLFNVKMNNKGYDTKFNIFDCSDMKNIELNFSLIIDKYDCPDIFINCSYPFTKDWSDTSFKNINLDSFQKNIAKNQKKT